MRQMTVFFGLRNFWNLGYLVLWLLSSLPADAQISAFVTRSGDKLILHDRPFYFLGANAYYLMESAARGDSSTVKEVLSAASSLGMTVIRTWAFHDSPDSLDPSVIQYRPGAFNERALRALDYVVLQAKLNNVKVVLTLVNSWDDYGGMNQYVRWRSGFPLKNIDEPPQKYSQEDQYAVVLGQKRQSYRVALSDALGHDDFYTDPLIRSWYRDFATHLLQRVNSYAGTMYKDEPAIFGWELANEPRSSDRSATIVRNWVEEMSDFMKSVDPNHLIGTGEEGFDKSPAGYATSYYNDQSWMFNGSTGTSFTVNTSLPSIDFASIHLYPENWNVSNSSGNVWIRDHIRISGAAGKPLLMGEFGVTRLKASTYSSWLTTALLDGAAGAIVWQLLDRMRNDAEGFGIHCPEDATVCATITSSAEQFNAKSISGTLQPPPTILLRQNYPNPFNTQTTIEYTLPVDSHVVLTLWNSLGQKVLMLVDAVQRAGVRREILDPRVLSSGPYFYRLEVEPLASGSANRFSANGKLMFLR